MTSQGANVMTIIRFPGRQGGALSGRARTEPAP